ncbi:MAG: ester cyclase [Dehalococcoidales bacterium]|nr:MAG: ester cyclase [Dehalococcoidales bacterium]
MGIEENKEIILHFFEEFNKGNSAIVDECFADNFVRYAADGQEMDREGYKNKIIKAMLNYFPDPHCTVADIVAEEDRVAFRFTWTATSPNDTADGSYKKGQQIKVTEDYFCRLENGKIVEFKNLIGR